MWLFLLCFLSCRGFYYEDEQLAEIEFTPCVSQYNLGVSKASNSSALLLVMQDGVIRGHGSANYFYSGKHKFFITAAHNLLHGNDFIIQENGGNQVKAHPVYVELGSDFAIVVADGEITQTTPVHLSINRKKDLVATDVYYMGSPGQLRFAMLQGFVMWSNADVVIMQSFGWFGASGSVVFDKGGRVVGILQGVYVDQHGLFEDVIEDVVYVQRVDFLSRKKLREIFNSAAEVRSGNAD